MNTLPSVIAICLGACVGALARWRRLLGLYVFFYSVLHFLAYAWLDMGFDPAAIAKDLAKRPFALVGFLGFVLLIPLQMNASWVQIRNADAEAQKTIRAVERRVAAVVVERCARPEPVDEGLLIVGWVAMWGPLDVFLYGWWPIAGRRRLFAYLARLDVELRPLK